MHPLLAKLTGGDRRSVGRVDEVVAQVERSPALFAALFQGLYSDDALVRMRAADALEKISARRPDLVRPYKRQLLGPVARIGQQEVQWHVAQMLPRLYLTARERDLAVKILIGYLAVKSKIVRTFALQALATFAREDPALRRRVRRILDDVMETGSPAMKARGRKLLDQLRKLGNP